ncbi:MAG: prepilin-type N-terminal cleavage/methylation domain-containing protein [Longimicrobiales bacterium]
MKKILKNRRGTTLLETLIALTLLGILITATLNLMNEQMRAFNTGASGADAMQNLRYAMSVLEKDMAPLGTNVSNEQPFLVYADSNVVAFNADYLSNVANDPLAVYVDTTANNLIASSVTKPRRFTIPMSSPAFLYPDTTYKMGASDSPAETIIFYFVTDATTPRADDYMLARKINDQPAEMIASGVLKLSGLPFFQYMERITPVSGLPFVQPVTAASLPLRHTRPLHGAVNDTGSFANIDRLRSIRVNFRVTDNQPGAKERIYPAARTLWFANAGIKIKQTCGDEPIMGSPAFTALPVVVDGVHGIQLDWNTAADELGGERDVIRYVIYRDTLNQPLSSPYLSIPSGNPLFSYQHVDYDIDPAKTYYYYIAAQDCTPTLSSVFRAAPFPVMTPIVF